MYMKCRKSPKSSIRQFNQVLHLHPAAPPPNRRCSPHHHGIKRPSVMQPPSSGTLSLAVFSTPPPKPLSNSFWEPISRNRLIHRNWSDLEWSHSFCGFCLIVATCYCAVTWSVWKGGKKIKSKWWMINVRVHVYLTFSQVTTCLKFPLCNSGSLSAWPKVWEKADRKCIVVRFKLLYCGWYNNSKELTSRTSEQSEYFPPSLGLSNFPQHESLAKPPRIFTLCYVWILFLLTPENYPANL